MVYCAEQIVALVLALSSALRPGGARAALATSWAKTVLPVPGSPLTKRGATRQHRTTAICATTPPLEKGTRCGDSDCRARHASQATRRQPNARALQRSFRAALV